MDGFLVLNQHFANKKLNFRIFSVPLDDTVPLLTKIRTSPGFDGVYVRTLTRFLYYEQISPQPLPNIYCKEPFLTLPMVMVTKKDFYLLEKINEKLDALKTAGLIDYWSLKQNQTLDDSSEPTVLTLIDVLPGFIILLIGYGFSFCAFVFENLRHSMIT